MKIVSIVGARPQFVKAFALSREIRRSRAFEEISIHTGQHFDRNMSAIFFEELQIAEPDYQLDIHGGTHGAMTGRMLAAIEEVLLKEKPAGVVVYGDTNSTVAGSLAAAKLQVPVIHVEAGLRSFNRAMPEEINRVVTDHLSDILLCPTTAAVENLRREGLAAKAHQTGDIMYDATLSVTQLAERHSKIIEMLHLTPGGYAVATLHRAENTASAEILDRLVGFLADLAQEQPVVFPVHPRTRITAENLGVTLERPGLVLTEPLGYLDMCELLHHAALIATDSGGVQKEAYFHRVPCVTMRSETEWIETIECGWNRLWTEPEYRPRRTISDYGNGDSAIRSVAVIANHLGSAR
jgi:UDP-GlcNAc3NAcA epimerase